MRSKSCCRKGGFDPPNEVRETSTPGARNDHRQPPVLEGGDRGLAAELKDNSVAVAVGRTSPGRPVGRDQKALVGEHLPGGIVEHQAPRLQDDEALRVSAAVDRAL